ncbi:hypothetical protein [Pedobacter zeae]|uniref:Uncharacterized protein n=1 Tax=Pedobacter zeae TaxID=1737356 RepID=A0A7W6K6P7_9SPHI|nr:hypothetical protein [Pedobacter zeae]MBB4106165.1 hypothetical protein [Pedobacter zeae]GGG99890.1 hypothetical protein GCM10007422_12950 [Pedobacter zeae]
MTLHKGKVGLLHEELTKLSDQVNILYEVDGLTHVSYQILNTFAADDWSTLNFELPKWNNKELEVLAYTMYSGDLHGETIDDNFTLGHIFTLADDSLATAILDQWLIFFFEENKVESIPLLELILVRLDSLKTSGYIGNSKYLYWVQVINTIKLK